MLQKLTRKAAQEGQENWEAGAQSNFMIAAARLGLRVASAANLGQDVYGDFLTNILKVCCFDSVFRTCSVGCEPCWQSKNG